jgi:hypothetical protein
MSSLPHSPVEEDLLELSKQGYFTIMLDENLRVSESALEDDGFKVIVPRPGLTDEALKRQARGWAILAKNSQDFIDDAVRYDYDVIGMKTSSSSTAEATVPTKPCARYPRPSGAAGWGPAKGISL